MTVWFTENASPGHRLQWKVLRTLYSGHSRFQKIEIVETESFGIALILDGIMQTTERDEFIYHEMLAAVPLAAHPHPQSVLVIGGGDGGLVSTLLQDARVQRIVLVELDEQVISLCRAFLPYHTRYLDDARLQVIIADGAQYLSELADDEQFDLILVDSTDPETDVGQRLYTPDFHASILRALSDPGVYVQHCGTPFYNPEVVSGMSADIADRFPLWDVYWSTVPTYPGTLFTFVAGLRGMSLHTPINRLQWETRWYTPHLHQAAFALPRQVESLLPTRPATTTFEEVVNHD